ncbi:MAG: flagellin lysine-N-methylase [Lachnospiraceae bacterium]|nr:flagellin lysine-N-methylase [Lachnospiraceae bacterium]
MRYVYPHYYHDFACTAGDCPDTCCAGWQIMIDDGSMERYEQYVGSFSERLAKGIDWNGGCFKQGKDKRCSMLNDDNLCDMIINMGENHLCRTCKLYPRHVEEFEGLREWSLSVSCPVAAHIVLSCEEPVHFTEENDDDDDPLINEFDDFDFLLFTELEDAREVIYKILQDRSHTIDERIRYLMELGKQLQTCVEENRISDMQDIYREFAKAQDAGTLAELCDDDDLPDLSDPLQRYDFLQENFSILLKLELLRDDWQEVLTAEKNMLAQGRTHYAQFREAFVKIMETQDWWPVFLENYLMSFVYTYFCGAVYDDWIDTKIMLGVFSVVFTEEFIMNEWLAGADAQAAAGKPAISRDACEKVAYRYVREVEHSDLNLNALEEFLHAVLFSPA